MNLIAGLGSAAGSGAATGATAGAATGAATTGAAASAVPAAAASATGAAAGGSSIFSNIMEGMGSLNKISDSGGGMGNASQAFSKMFGGEVSKDNVDALNTFQVGGQTKRKQSDPLDDTRQQFQDWMSLMSFTQ